MFGSDAEEFRRPFYMITNLAVGGAYTDAYRLGDPGSGQPVSMPFPATMYVDYVRVYQWNGQGEVHLGPPTPHAGRYGIFTDTTPTNGGLQAGVSSEIYVWEGTLVAGTTPPYEGANGLAWQTNGRGWFGAGIQSHQPENLFDLGDGSLKFRIRIPANVTFKIGIIDSWGNQSYVSFPAFQTKYGLVRDGNWGQASIPVSELRGPAIDLRLMSYEFVILEEQGTACQFAIDDIYYESPSVIGVDDPAAPPPGRVHLSSAPNPFRSSTELRFDLAGTAEYEITVFDMAGRRVAAFRGLGQAGANAVRWDGRDAQGQRARSGVYAYRLAAGGQSASGKVVLLD